MALQVDQGLAAAWSDAGARESSLLAAQSLRWPIADLETSYRLRDNEPAFLIDATALGGGIVRSPYLQKDEFASRASVRLPLYTGGKITNAIAAAESDFAAAHLESQRYQLDVKLQVAAEYIEVLRAAKHLAAAQHQLQHVAAHAADVRRMFDRGLVPANHFLSVDVARADAEIEALQAANRLEAARHAYNRRLGRPLDAPVHLAALSFPNENLNAEQLTAQAIQRRPELAMLDAQASQLFHEADRVAAQNRPQLHLEAAHEFQTNRFQSPNGISSAAILGTWQPYNGGRTGHDAEALRARGRAVTLRRADLQSRIRLEIRRAILDVQAAQRRVEVSAQAIRQAEENLRVVRGSYQEGTGTSTEVLDAISLRQRASRRHFDSAYDAIFASIRLHHAAGDL